MNVRTILFVMFGLCFSVTHAQSKYTVEDYIRMYHEAAVSNMVKHKVPASITLAQGIFESGFGNSPLAINANNHFGIKCHDWKGDTYNHDDDAPQECFRKYKNVEESYADHAAFLKGRKRYAKCFELTLTDYAGWARELKAAGYATLPTYAEKITDLIERMKLHEYDKMGMAMINGEKVPEVEITSAGNAPIPVAENPDPTDPETFDSKVPVTKPSETLRTNIPEHKPEPISVAQKIKREPSENNGVAYIVSRNGDTQATIAEEFDLAEWQIRRYNELDIDQKIPVGIHIYLEPKKDHNAQIDVHIVAENETLTSISRMHAIKKSALMELNGLTSEHVLVGQSLRLR